MRRLGFIHDMMDVKVLILFVMARVSYPVMYVLPCLKWSTPVI